MMNYKTKDKIEQAFNDFKEAIYIKVIRPIKKARRRKEYEARRKIMQQAKGELIEGLDKFMVNILNEALSKYRDSKQQNHYTIQASHDIKAIYENVLSDYVNSTK